MSIILTENRYGKSGVRLVKVEHLGSRHEIKDLNVEVQLSGDFSPAYLEGDNRKVLPTDTMKNTVYALAREQPLGEIEESSASAWLSIFSAETPMSHACGSPFRRTIGHGFGLMGRSTITPSFAGARRGASQ